MTSAGYLFAIAEDDDKEAPNEKVLLKSVLEPRSQWHEVEVYSAQHGWCPPDGRVYNEAAAEKAWSPQLEMFKAELKPDQFSERVERSRTNPTTNRQEGRARRAR